MTAHDPDQGPELERVSHRIARLVIDFCRERRRAEHPEFFATELRVYVTQASIAAPASPDRVLRDLRQKGRLGYTLLSRPRSLYRIDWVGLPGGTQLELLA